MDDEIACLNAIEAIEEVEENVRVPRRIFDQRDPFALSDAQFISAFRLNKALVRQLIVAVEPFLVQPSRQSALSIERKVLVALRFYATGSYQSDTGFNMYVGVSQSSVSRAISEVTEALNNRAIVEVWIKFPRNINELQELRQRFYNKTRFPGVIGCIDCTHIAIVAPPKSNLEQPEHIYVNRKNYHSINVQLICDAYLKIIHINAKYPGSTHDAFIWRNSNVSNVVENIYREYGNNYFLLGDAGYPLRPWLITPLEVDPEPGSPAEAFNKAHRQTRSIIERCNGVLKARFRCLLKHRVLHYTPTVASKITTACAILHNMCIENGIEDPHDENNMAQLEECDIEQRAGGPLERVNPDLVAGRRIQQQLIRNHFT